VRKNWETSEKLSKFNDSFPSTACPPTFHKINVLHNDLKKDATNKFGKKIDYQTQNGTNFRNMGTPYTGI
jgi:hypothetical protein